MENSKLSIITNTIFNIALVAGIVYLASNNSDGWGWLILILLLKEC